MATAPYTTRIRVGLLPTSRDDKRAERDAPVEPVDEHRFGEHEAADEQEDDRVGERRERGARRSHLQDDRQHRSDERGDRQRQRLGDPEDDHHRKNCRQPVRRDRQPHRQYQQEA